MSNDDHIFRVKGSHGNAVSKYKMKMWAEEALKLLQNNIVMPMNLSALGAKTMGCDIHTFCEEYIHGRWFSLEDFDEDGLNWRSNIWGGRNYEFFTFLAGVRSQYNDHVPQPFGPPRGFPAEKSDEMNMLFDNIDFHSSGWVFLDEFLEKPKWKDRTATFDTYYHFQNHYRQALCLAKGRDPSRVRITFAFEAR